jgi:hypothetical protein
MRDNMTSIGLNGRFSDDSLDPYNILALIATFYTPVCPRRGYNSQVTLIVKSVLRSEDTVFGVRNT